jgi:hypothetical protein
MSKFDLDRSDPVSGPWLTANFIDDGLEMLVVFHGV